MFLSRRRFFIVCKRNDGRLVLLLLFTILIFGLLATVSMSNFGADQINSHDLQINRKLVQQANKEHGTSLSFSPNQSTTSKKWREIFPNDKIFRKNLPDSQALKLVYLRDRLKRAQAKCSEGWKPKYSVDYFDRRFFYYDGPKRMVYCQSSKVGSTFWGRVLGFLTREEEMNSLGISDIFQISKMDIHTGLYGPAFKVPWSTIVQSVAKEHTLKLLFTRNPYSRLWSIFLDKFYLLGEWEQKGRSEFWCKDFDSFERFLEKALNSSDSHVRLISETCDPCKFKPHVIGHMETFDTDAAFILNQTLYGYLLKSHSREYRVEIEINSTIVDNFLILSLVRQKRKVCLDEKALCERLWRVFQYQGYISSDTSFPTGRIDYSEKAMVPIFLQAARNISMTRQKSQQQKHRSIAEAYKNIPQTLIRQIQIRYEGDFEMFGYDSTPPS